jgi:Predicted membrane protein
MSSSRDQNVVVDVAQSRISDFWKLEDYWAIWLGFAILFVAYICFASSGPQAEAEKQLTPIVATLKAEQERAPFKTIAWHDADRKKSGVQSRKNDAGKFFAQYLATPKRWSENPLGAFFLSKEDAQAKSDKATENYNNAKAATVAALEKAKEAEKVAENANFADESLNSAATDAIGKWQSEVKKEGKAKDAASVKGYNLFTTLPLLGLALGIFLCTGAICMGWNVRRFLVGFLGVFFVAVLAMLLGNQTEMRYYGVSAEVWAIALGMIVANTIKTPEWLKNGLQVEYFIKIGLVLLGAEVLLSKLIAIGTAGIFVAWAVTPTVLIVTFIFGQKILKMESKRLNIVISADMSVCGTSAAIATAAACRAKKEELTVAIGISLAFTATMMIFMPMGIKFLGLNQVLGGAWIGGVVDSTGAVTAAGAFLGPVAMTVAATVKMIQNVLIGFTAFATALYWVTYVDRQHGVPINPFEIWHRFPKFVIGFFLASVAFSFVGGAAGVEVANATIDQGVITGMTSGLRGWFFALAFTAIGLSTDFRALAPHFKGGKAIILYITGQSFNLWLTLLAAYLMYEIVFPEVTRSLLNG